MTKMLLTVKNLTKTYNKKNVLKNINFSVEEKEIVSIIGPSGSGKSTLLRCINRMVTPTSGEILFDRKLITSANIGEIRKEIGMVFQHFNLFENLTVLENITLAPIKLKLLSPAEAKKRALAMLKEINLYDKKDSYPISLSGGEKQRVAIIRTLILEPRLILLDEPTSALDPEMTKEVIELIKHLKDKGITLIIVSHEMEFVKEFSNRIIFIENGKLILDSSYNKIINGENDRVKNFIQDIEK